MSLTDLIAENVGVAVVCLLAIFIAVWQLGHLSALWCKKSSFSLLNKHILITGGSQGLGRALAVECARQGAKVTIVARNPNVLNEAKEFITNAAKATPHTPLKSETSVFTASADVTNEAQVQSAMDAAEKANGPIDMLITCAGSAVTGHLMKVSTADHRRSMEVCSGYS
jgi:NAD(P)-dependent dehydrogenase (short-subunit alcohol dehydrogenase family)